MKTYATERTVEGPYRDSDPIDRLIAFYRANGYDLVEREVDEASTDREETPREDSAVLMRGEAEASWWSSDMTKLSNRVELQLVDETSLRIQYRVDVTGQHLTDSDREFWDRELSAAIEYLDTPSRTPRDLRHEEAKRAERIRRRMLSYGIWGAVIVFLLVLLLNVLTTNV